MKVRMVQKIHFKWTREIGEVVDLADADARMLILGGYAESLVAPAAPAPEPDPVSLVDEGAALTCPVGGCDDPSRVFGSVSAVKSHVRFKHKG